MKRLLFIIILLSNTVITKAQLQFWNIADIEDAPWAAARKQQKVKRVYIYRTDERGARLDSSTANEVQLYSSSGALLSKTYYKTDWAKRSRQLQRVDSFMYNEKGQLTRYLSCEGAYREPAYETTVTCNSKGQPVSQDDYTVLHGVRTKEQTETWTYNTKGQVIKTSAKSTSAALNFTRLFTYDAAGQMIRSVFSPGPASITTTYTWGKKREITGWQQTQDKALQKNVTYTYDELGRITNRHTKTPGDYSDNTVYSYAGNSLLPAYTAMEYTGSNGKNDRRVEYNEFVYEYY